MESNEELLEKPTGKRRSSILKLPKPRYEDVDLTDTYTDITLSRPTRRVSFASSNFIKPFVADPEKNTIWDITYEEDVNHTNSTQSSQEHIVSNYAKLDSTFLESPKACSKVSNVTIWSEKDMELTKAALFVDKENIPFIPQRKISIVDYAKKLSSNSTAPLFDLSLNSRHGGIFEEVGSSTKLYTQNMEITCQIPDNTVRQEEKMEMTNISVFDACESNMELTCHGLQTNHDMEVPCQIPAKKSTNDIHQVPKNNFMKEGGDMDFIGQLPQSNVFKMSNLNITSQILTTNSPIDSDCQISNNALIKEIDMQLTHQVPQLEVDDGMDITCEIPTTKTQNNDQVPNRTLIKGADMEFTCQVPLTNNLTKENNDLKKTMNDMRNVENNVVKGEDGLEFTCQVVQTNVSKVNEDMEFTCQIPMTKKVDDNSNQIPTSTLIKEIDDMDFTCQVPLTNTSNKSSHCQNLQNNEKTFACQIGSEKATNDTVQVFQNNEMKGSHEMEFTCQVPLPNTSNKNSPCQDLQNNLGKENKGIILPGQTGSKKPTNDKIQVFQNNVMKGANDMEFTCQVSQRAFSKANQDMQLTCRIPATKTTNDTHSQAFKSEATEKDEMEFTCQVSAAKAVTCQMPTIKITSSNITFQDSQSNLTKIRGNVDFANMTKVADDVEFTCQLPVMTDDAFSLVPQGNSTMMGDNSEFSCQIPATKTTDELEKNESHVNETTKIIGKNASIYSPMDISYATDVGTLIDAESNQLFSNPKKVSSEQSDPHMSVDKSSIMVAHGVEKSLDNLKLPFADTSCNTSKLTPKKVDASLIPIKKKSSIPPEMSSFKKQRMPFSERQEPHLDITCQSTSVEALKSKLASSAHKLSNLSKLKQDVSAPESSFHINLTNISSGVDETQHLLQCTYSCKPAFTTSKLDDAIPDNTSCTINLEGVRNINNYAVATGLPKLDNSRYTVENNLSDNFEQTTADATIFCDVQKNKLSRVNDTYVLRSKRTVVNSSTEAAEESDMIIEDDASLGIIPDECIEKVDNDWHTPVNNVTRTAKKFQLQEFNYTIKRVSEVSDLQERIKKQRDLIKDYLESFKCRATRCPKEFNVLEKSSLDSSALVGEISDEVFCTPSMEEKIRTHQKSCQNCWKLEKVDGDVYHFCTLFGTLVFIVELNSESGKVTEIWKSSRLSTANSKPISRYIMKLLMDKLSDGHIKSAIGDSYDVLSLLDYIQMSMLRLDGFLREFMESDNLSMEEDFVVKFKILSVPSVVSCNVLVDVADIDNLNCEENIKIVTDIGVVNESEIKKMAQNCPKGLDFFQSFLSGIQDYIAKLKDKRKRLDNIKK